MQHYSATVPERDSPVGTSVAVVGPTHLSIARRWDTSDSQTQSEQPRTQSSSSKSRNLQNAFMAMSWDITVEATCSGQQFLHMTVTH